MPFVVAGLLAGLLALHATWPFHAPLAAVVLLAGLLCLALRRRLAAAVCIAFVMGAAITAGGVAHYLDARWSPAVGDLEVVVEGRIAGLPTAGGRSVRFPLRVNSPGWSGPRQVRVSWFAPADMPQAGERWRLQLRLRAVSAPRNPGAFDLERWYAAERVHAVAQVTDGSAAERLEGPAGLHALRATLSERVRGVVADERAGAMAVALLVGDRRFLGGGQWQALLDTGTNHLVAISGLHVSLAAGGAWWVCIVLWRTLSPWCHRVPARLAGAVPALAAAAGYSALAGFALPTQRALLMLTVAILALCSRRTADPPLILLLAAIAVLLRDPLAPLHAGFWLSFLAVAALVAVASGRMHRPEPGWRTWMLAQAALFLSLAPVTAAAFGHIPLISPLANAFAVPVVGLLAVPLLLISLPMRVVMDTPADFVIGWAGWILSLLDAGLAWLAAVAPVIRQPVPPPMWLGVGTLVLAILYLRGAGRQVLLPLGFCAAVVALWQPGSPPPGQARVHVLDAGYGHATYVRTRSHVLLVDTGPASFRRGLRRAMAADGRDKPDRVVITRDRAGHHANLVDWWGSGKQFGVTTGRSCDEAGIWERDGVTFLVRELPAGNCLVQVAAGGDVLIVATGVAGIRDWEAIRSLESAGAVVVLPGHGHRDLGPPSWFDPAVAVIPADAHRRHGLPHAELLQHLAARGIPTYLTGCHGAVQIDLGAGERPRAARERRRWWNAAEPFGRDGNSYIISDVCKELNRQGD